MSQNQYCVLSKKIRLFQGKDGRDGQPGSTGNPGRAVSKSGQILHTVIEFSLKDEDPLNRYILAMYFLLGEKRESWTEGAERVQRREGKHDFL